jgi:molecular chaperone DnaJ
LAKRDYYEVLGVPRDADPNTLKSAYRKLALQYHPDRNPDDPAAEEKFKEASEAYAILSDPEKRRNYDSFGFAGVGTGGGPGAPGFDFGDLGGFGDIFNDLFGDIFGGRPGGGRGRGRGQRGADLRYNLEVELTDVRSGIEAQVEIPKTRACATCSGSGARAGTRPETCARCRGAGQVVLQQGFFRISRPCEECGGAGEIVRERCADCRGSGRTQSIQRVKVKVPPGVDDGVRLRLSGEGEAGIAGGPPGDLYVVIGVKPHPLFERDGGDLHCKVPITFAQAALGAEIEVPTLDGKVKLRIPEGTQSGKVLRMRGKGLPSLRSSALGDQHVHVFVEVPAKLSKRQRELLEQFAAEGGEDVLPERQGFLDKLRDLFE